MKKYAINYFTYVSAFSANLLTFGAGIGYGWSSPALSKLSGQVHPETNPLETPTTYIEDSWIASLLSFGAVCSPWITAFLTDIIGRKNTLLIFSIPMMLSHVIGIFANEVYHFYIARFLIGLSVGCMFAVVPVYGAEIATKHNRGIVGITLNIMLTSGHLFAVAIGPYMTIAHFSIVCLIPSIIFLTIFGLFIPETPYFYAFIGKNDEVEKSLKKLRGTDNVEEELTEILKSAESQVTEKGSFKELFTTKHHLKALILVVCLMFFHQMSGIIFVVSYTQKIFDLAQTGLSSDISVIVVCTMQVVAVLISSQTIERFSRKSLMIFSLFLMGIANIAMGTYFYLKSQGNDLSSISWLPVASLMIFISGFNIGIGPLAFTFSSEIFEHRVKSWGMTIAITANVLSAFISTSALPTVAETFGVDIPFWIFGGVSAVAILFVAIFIPETRGKSFMEIHSSLGKQYQHKDKFELNQVRADKTFGGADN